MCVMAINNEFNGIELTFAEKPDEGIRSLMKAAGFRWHRVKKLWYAKKSDDRMALAAQLSGQNSPVQAPAAAPKNSPAETVSRYGIKVGDIVYDVWGYSMTIVDYYKVTKIISPCKVEIVEVGHNLIASDRGGGERVLPEPDREIGERIIKQVTKDRHGDGWYIKINSSVQLTLWDGQAHYQNTWD